MDTPDARSLSPEAQQALRERVIVALEHEGLTCAEAARVFGVHRSTVSGWWNAYRRHGADTLRARRRGPKPQPLLTGNQHQRLWHV